MNIQFPNKMQKTLCCVFIAEEKMICEWDEETYMELMPNEEELSIEEYRKQLKEIFLTTNFRLAHQEEVNGFHWFPKYMPCIHPDILYTKPKTIQSITVEKIREYYELLLGCKVSILYYTKEESTTYIPETKKEESL